MMSLSTLRDTKRKHSHLVLNLALWGVLDTADGMVHDLADPGSDRQVGYHVVLCCVQAGDVDVGSDGLHQVWSP